MDAITRAEVLRSYGTILAKSKNTVALKKSLPFQREVIEQAILDELRTNPHIELREQLKVAFLSLDIFVADEEFKIAKEYEHITEKVTALPHTADAELRELFSAMELVAESYVRMQRQVQEKQQESNLRLVAFLDSLNQR